jgi:hypothetical protein
METTLNEQAFLNLTEENQEKVHHIYAIAVILKEHGMNPMTEQEFDELYDKTVEELSLLSGILPLRIQALMLSQQMHEMFRGGRV